MLTFLPTKSSKWTASFGTKNSNIKFVRNRVCIVNVVYVIKTWFNIVSILNASLYLCWFLVPKNKTQSLFAYIYMYAANRQQYVGWWLLWRRKLFPRKELERGRKSCGRKGCHEKWNQKATKKSVRASEWNQQQQKRVSALVNGRHNHNLLWFLIQNFYVTF